MRLNQLATSAIIAINQVFGWVLWRAVGYALIGLFALLALYHFTAAGTLLLEAWVGALYARLILAALFTVAALVVFGILARMRANSLRQPPRGPLSEHRPMQIAMLVEALILGFSSVRKKPPTR
jgi:hypothetical protein